MTEPQGGPPPPGQKQALYDAAVAAVEDAERRSERTGRGRGPWGRRIGLLTAALVVGFGLYLLIARPAWFLTPPPPPESLQVQEASVRMMLVREAGRIRSIAAGSGRLPEDLKATGSLVLNLRYQRLSDSSFLVAAPFGTGELTLRSTDPTADFLGRSLSTVTNRGNR
jgi:hypothetical protein